MLTIGQHNITHGLHFNVPFEQYLSWPILSQSALKNGADSAAHLRAAIDGERRVDPTDDMMLGSALHCAFLEPDKMVDRVVKWSGGVRRGKAWDAFREENNGRVILTEDMHAKLSGMLQSLRRHPVVRQWVSKIEHVEVSSVGTYCDVEMKGRCDALTSEPLIDLKKMVDASPDSATKTVLRLGYHLQGAIYKKLFGRGRFMLIAVEDKPPYDVVPYELSPAFLRAGEREACGLLDRLKFATKHNRWAGRSDEVIQLELPEWAAEDSGVDFGGGNEMEVVNG